MKELIIPICSCGKILCGGTWVLVPHPISQHIPLPEDETEQVTITLDEGQQCPECKAKKVPVQQKEPVQATA